MKSVTNFDCNHISTRFDEQGFLHIPSVIEIDSIRKIVNEIDSIKAKSIQTNDILVENHYPRKFLYAFDKHPEFLRLLAHDTLLDILSCLSPLPQQIVPTWEDIVIASKHHANGFVPHQDLPLQSTSHKVFSIAIYLTSGHDSAVSFLPGSHQLGPLTRKQIQQQAMNKPDKFVAVRASQGDIIVHNALTIHYSSPNTTAQDRITWYLEFRTITALREDSPWSEDWIMLRRTIFAYALEKYNHKRLLEFIPEYDEIRSKFNTINVKVPHVTDNVDYDMTSPYYHF